MKALIAFVLALSIATSAFARDLNITGCTKDKQKAVLTVDVNAAADSNTVAEIIMAFVKTAKVLTAEVLVSGEGFRVFAENLSEAARDAIDGINAPPAIDGRCD